MIAFTSNKRIKDLLGNLISSFVYFCVFVLSSRRRADLNPKVNSIRMLAFCMGSLFHIDGFLVNLIPLFDVCISEKAPPVQRKPLKHRDYEVDLESRLGKTQVCYDTT